MKFLRYINAALTSKWTLKTGIIYLVIVLICGVWYTEYKIRRAKETMIEMRQVECKK
jgi:hypothetical protein